jgi:glucose uptake protein GlcU
MPIFAWKAADITYVIGFLVALIVIVGGFFLASYYLSWRNKRKYEMEIREIERKSALTDAEADYVVYIANKNKLNVPTGLYTTLRTFDSLVGRDIELLMDSAAPQAEKKAVVQLAYGARAKLFPETVRIEAAPEALQRMPEGPRKAGEA